MRLGIALVLLVSAAAPARAQFREEAAKEAFFAGKAAYEAKKFDEALEQFKRCYTLGGQPVILYNIASTLQNLERPGEAADTLREYLKIAPSSADRPDIEARIANLERAQKLVDRDRERKRKLEDEEHARRQRELDLQRQASPGAGWVTEAEAAQRASLAKEREQRRRKRTLGLALGVSLGALVLGGVIVGAVCGTGHCSPEPVHDFDFGKVTVTP